MARRRRCAGGAGRRRAPVVLDCSPGVPRSHEATTARSCRELCLCASRTGRSGDCGPAQPALRRTPMSDSSISQAQRQKITLPADARMERLIHDPDPAIVTAVAGDQRLTEDLALALLERRDLPREALEELHKNSGVAKLRKVRLA